MAQRLVRTLCPHCKAAVEPDEKSWQELVAPFNGRVPERIYRPVGCIECRNTGYRGRLGLYEMLRLTRPIRELVGPATDTDAIRRQAFREHMRPLRLAGARQVAAGATTVEEVLRVTPPAQGD